MEILRVTVRNLQGRQVLGLLNVGRFKYLESAGPWQARLPVQPPAAPYPSSKYWAAEHWQQLPGCQSRLVACLLRADWEAGKPKKANSRSALGWQQWAITSKNHQISHVVCVSAIELLMAILYGYAVHVWGAQDEAFAHRGGAL